MHRVDWHPGQEGKGIVAENGDVHAWGEDDYELHNDYVNEHPSVGSPQAYFYVRPKGEIELTMPSPLYERPEYDQMMEHICEADPHFHDGTDMDKWRF